MKSFFNFCVFKYEEQGFFCFFFFFLLVSLTLQLGWGFAVLRRRCKFLLVQFL